MTEIGMALSNRIDGTRFPGSHPQPCHEGVAMHDCLDDHATRCVGWPLPDVEVKQDEVLVLHGYSPETDQMLVVQDGGILVKGQDLRKWHENAALWGRWAK